jgi:hypothetical protein
MNCGKVKSLFQQIQRILQDFILPFSDELLAGALTGFQ